MDFTGSMKKGKVSAAICLAPAAVFFVLAIGLYFRSYELLPQGSPSPEKKVLLAEAAVRQAIQGQILRQLETSGSQIPEAARQAFAAQQADVLIQADQTHFKEAVAQFLSNMPGVKSPPVSRHYLLESDPYHYLAQVQNLLETGRIAERVEGGKFFDPLRHYPKGWWIPVGGHPYIGILVYKAAAFFHPAIDLMEGLGYVPLVLTAAVVLAFFILCRSLGLGLTAFTAGGVSLVLSPIFLQRSSYGWFDTDPYNHFFPALILASFFYGIQGTSPRRAAAFGLAGGVLTGLYVYFWVGWPFIFLLVLGSAFVLSCWRWIKRRPGLENAPVYFGTYAAFSIAAALVTATPAGFLEYLSRGAQYLVIFSSGQPDESWPNIFIMVGETTSVSLKRMIYLTGNAVTTGAFFIGLASGPFLSRFSGQKEMLPRWVVFVLLSVPLFYLSLRTERFALLFVLPGAVFVAMGIQLLSEIWEKELKARLPASLQTFPALRKALFAGLVLAVLFPMQLLFAHALALKSEPIMNDVWYSGMQAIREKTPADALIYTWWPPGYFITSLTQRRVFSDGGTQDVPECYWIARFFMASSETEAMGIMRMLNTAGNDAVESLQKSGLRLPEAIDVINKILPLSAGEAEKVLTERVGAQKAQDILKLTHTGNFLMPSNVFLYNEMVDKNLALSVFARWNFHKAALLKRTAPKKEGFLAMFSGAGKDETVRKFLASSDGILKYRPEEALEKREGDTLFFKNGLIVDWAAKTALIQVPSERVDGRPASLFYLENGEMKESVSADRQLDMSALVYEDQGTYYSVLADRQLILSMLYRLYYLKGGGLQYFKAVFEDLHKDSGMRVQLFEVDWEKYRAQHSEAGGVS